MADLATRSFCTFWLGNARYGVEVRAVKEVNTLPPLTPVPRTPPEVRGLVNLRGQIHLVLDLKRLLGLGETALTDDTRLVLFKPSVGESFGVLVDRIDDIAAVDDAHIEYRGHGGEMCSLDDADLVTGVGKLDDGLLVIIASRRLIPAARRVLQAR